MLIKRTVLHDRKSKKVKRNKQNDGFLNLFRGETVESLKSERDKLKKQLEDEKKKRDERTKLDDERRKIEDERRKMEDEKRRSQEINKLLEDDQKQKIKEEIDELKKQIKEVKYQGKIIPKQDSYATQVVIDDNNKVFIQNSFPQNPVQPIKVEDVIIETPTKLSNKIERTQDTSVLEIATSFVLFGGFLTGVIVLLNNKN